MEDLTLLRDLILILAIGVGVALALRGFGVPSLAGFILAGILVGPRSLGLVSDAHEVELLAEIGIVLLLFGIGLEMSLEKVRRLWKPILLGGSLQLGLTIALAAWISTTFALGWRQGVFIGFMVAISSTAIVLRGLEFRGTIDAPHGRFALGILVFQDLSVVPMMLAIPLLAQTGGSGWESLLALGKAVAVVLGVLVASRLVVPRLLHFVARTRQRDLFVLVVLLLCVGTAWVVALVGVSLALGAFLAGLVVAGSDYRNQAMADLIPFREVLASLFFISVGMLLDPTMLIFDPLPVLGILGAILVAKFVIVVAVGLVLRLPLRVALITGMTLAHTGEFLFVLLKAADGVDLIDDQLASQLMTAAILSMLVTPLLMYLSPRVAAGVSGFGLFRWLARTGERDDRDGAPVPQDHVIIAGHGIAGEELAGALRQRGIPYLIVDLNAEAVKLLAMQGEPAHFGDVTNVEVLERLGIHRAAELVVTISDPGAALRAVGAARELNPNLPILVRVRYVNEVDELLEAGATRVVPSEYESAVEIVSRVLARHSVPREEIDAQIESMHSRCRVKDR
jgi:CPA2 family monovalent cation:H+ antiporter-2